jgi:hypothetical protein
MAQPPDFVALSTLTAAQMNLVGGWVVKRDTIVAGATHIVSGAFNADFTNYQVLITGVTVVTGTPNMLMQLRTGASTATSAYFWGGTNSNYSTRTDENSAGTTSSWKLGLATTTATQNYSVQVFRPFEATGTTFYCNSASVNASYQAGGVHTTAASYDQFVLSVSSSTLVGGTVIVIGYRD